MELVVRKTDLLRELQLFQGIVERKNTIPILANVLIEAEGEQVRLLATDLEVGLRSKCPASVSKSGSLTLPAKKLYEIVKALPDTDVRIEEDKNGVKVAADRFVRVRNTEVLERVPKVDGLLGTRRWMDIVQVVRELRKGPHPEPLRRRLRADRGPDGQLHRLHQGRGRGHAEAAGQGHRVRAHVADRHRRVVRRVPGGLDHPASPAGGVTTASGVTACR